MILDGIIQNHRDLAEFAQRFFMSAILMIVIFLAVFIGLNVIEFGRPD